MKRVELLDEILCHVEEEGGNVVEVHVEVFAEAYPIFEDGYVVPLQALEGAMEIESLEFARGGLVADIGFEEGEGFVETGVAIAGDVVEGVVHAGKLPVEHVKFFAGDNEVGGLVVAMAGHELDVGEILPYLVQPVAEGVPFRGNSVHSRRGVRRRCSL